MTTLEEKSIAAFRKKLLNGDSATLRTCWDQCKTVKGGNESGIFDEMLARDVLAYTILQLIFLQGGFVYGGFVAAHYSGKPWTDLDLSVLKATRAADLSEASLEISDKIMSNIFHFISFVLSIPTLQLRCRRHVNNNYGIAYDLICMVNDYRIVIKIDMTFYSSIRGNVLLDSQHYTFIPVTLGKCLCMDLEGTRLRNIPSHNHLLLSWKVKDIIEMLESGTDVMLCLRGNKHRIYREYFWFRIEKIKKHWTLLQSNESPPLEYSESKLSHLIERMTKLSVERAA